MPDGGDLCDIGFPRRRRIVRRIPIVRPLPLVATRQALVLVRAVSTPVRISRHRLTPAPAPAHGHAGRVVAVDPCNPAPAPGSVSSSDGGVAMHLRASIDRD